jgi:hypothetical protein
MCRLTLQEKPVDDVKNSREIVPVGAGGVVGRVLRIAIHFSTGGFMYPNVFIEGMDLMKKHRQDTKMSI